MTRRITRQHRPPETVRDDPPLSIPLASEQPDPADPFIDVVPDKRTLNPLDKGSEDPIDPQFVEVTSTTALERRLDDLRELRRLYTTELFKLAEELELRHETYAAANPDAPARLSSAHPIDVLRVGLPGTVIGLSDLRAAVASTSHPQPPSFLQVQEVVLAEGNSGRKQAAAIKDELKVYRQGQRNRGQMAHRLELAASGMGVKDMEANEALAGLWGRGHRLFIRRPRVVIGSGEEGSKVDVALGGPGVAPRQAVIILDVNGIFHIRNTSGGSPLIVNGSAVAKGRSVSLPHLSLIEVGGRALMFGINTLAVDRFAGRNRRHGMEAGSAGLAAAAVAVTSPEKAVPWPQQGPGAGAGGAAAAVQPAAQPQPPTAPAQAASAPQAMETEAAGAAAAAPVAAEAGPEPAAEVTAATAAVSAAEAAAEGPGAAPTTQA